MTIHLKSLLREELETTETDGSLTIDDANADKLATVLTSLDIDPATIIKSTAVEEEKPEEELSSVIPPIGESVKRAKPYKIDIAPETIEQAKELFKVGQAGANWYYEAYNTLKDAFQGNDQDRTLFTLLLAATSVRNEIYPNFIEAATLFNAIKKDMLEQPELLTALTEDENFSFSDSKDKTKSRPLDAQPYSNLNLFKTAKTTKIISIGAKFGNIRRVLSLYVDGNLDADVVKNQIIRSLTSNLHTRFDVREPLIKAMKIANYSLTLLDPSFASSTQNPYNVVVDTWMIRAFFPDASKELQGKLLADEDVYAAITRTVSELAAQADVSPHVMQAAIWTGKKKTVEGESADVANYVQASKKLAQYYAAAGKDLKDGAESLKMVIDSLDLSTAKGAIHKHRADWMRNIVVPKSIAARQAKKAAVGTAQRTLALEEFFPSQQTLSLENLIFNEEEDIEEACGLAGGGANMSSAGNNSVVGWNAPLGMNMKKSHEKEWGTDKNKKVKSANPSLAKESFGAMNPPVDDPPIPSHNKTTQAMPGLWKGEEDPNKSPKTSAPLKNLESKEFNGPLKTLNEIIAAIIREMLEETGYNKALLKKMGYEYAGKSYRLGSDAFVYDDDPAKEQSKKYIRMANKEQNKSHTASGRLHDPGAVGLTLPRKLKG